MKSKNLILGMTLVLLSVWSCEKTEINSESLLSESLLTTESIQHVTTVDGVDEVLDETMYYADGFVDFFDIIRSNGHDSKKQGCRDRSGHFPDCAVIVQDTVGETITTTISFEDGCMDRDSNTLSGTAVFVKTSNDDGKERSATFTDFTVNGNVVNGTKNYIRNINSSGNPEITSTVNITIVTDSGTIMKSGNKVLEITAGGDTDTHQDDEITTTGSSSYTNENGEVMSSEIISPLVKPAECKYISQGVKQYSDNGTVSTVNFGDGTCDDVAIKTDSEGVETEISLKKRSGKKRR